MNGIPSANEPGAPCPWASLQPAQMKLYVTEGAVGRMAFQPVLSVMYQAARSTAYLVWMMPHFFFIAPTMAVIVATSVTGSTKNSPSAATPLLFTGLVLSGREFRIPGPGRHAESTFGD